MLSQESQNLLKTRLPPTAFVGFQASIDQDHPSATPDPDAMAVDQLNPSPSSDLDISIFTDPHFLAAAHTLQDHIYSDWMSESHAQKTQKYLDGIRDGTLAAAWKDEVWLRNNTSPIQVPSGDQMEGGSKHLLSGVKESAARAGCVPFPSSY